jgi:hypothetical protein
MSKICHAHCPSGGGGGAGFALAAVAVVIVATMIAKPAEHAAADILHLLLVCMEILAAVTVVSGAIAATVLVRRHARASCPPALPARTAYRVRATNAAAAIAPHEVLDGTLVDMATIRERNAR